MFNKFYLKLILATITSVLCPFYVTSPVKAASFSGLGDLPGGDFSSAANRVSADGSVVTGISASEQGLTGEAFRWTAVTGMIGLGDLPGGIFLSGGFAISDDGFTVAGVSSSEASALSAIELESFLWTADSGLIPLGDLPGGSFSSFTTNISGNGLVVVGDSDTESGREAFRWTAETGIVGLGDFPDGAFTSGATDASFDGSIIVGNGNSSTGVQGFRWTEETGLIEIEDLPGGEIFSNATSISNDGLTIVGRSSSTNTEGIPITNDQGAEAFRWTAETGIVGLGDLPGGIFSSTAIAVSEDGSIIVGQGNSSSGEEPFIWDSLNGIRSLTQLLTNDFNLDLNGWDNLVVGDISADGLTIVGFGDNPDGNLEGWIANIAPETTQVPESSPVLGFLAFWGIVGVRSLLRKQKGLNLD